MAKAKRPARPARGDRLDAEGVIYARFSSHSQKEASIDQQIEWCCALAKEYGIRVVETYADRAVSGRTDKRADFQRMMKDAGRGRFRYVIAWKSNRIGRNMLEALVNEASLKELGVRILYVEEDFDDSAAGRFAARSMMNINQFYSENLAEDVRRGMLDNAQRCMVTNGQLTYGYKADETLHYQIDEEKAEVVREIFTRVAAGEPFVDIFTSLNARGIRTGRGGEWKRTSLNNIIRNERYRGIYIYSDVRIEGGIPRIISDDLFFKVQEVLKTKKNPQGRHRENGDYLLTGKLFCGKCGSPMTGISGTGRNGLHFYYTCQKRRTEKTCQKENVRRDEIEDLVAQAIKEHVLRDDVIEWIADQTVKSNQEALEQSGIPALEARLSEAKKAAGNLVSAIEQGIITETTKARLLALEKEQSELSQKITAARADIIMVPKEIIVEGLSMFKDCDITDKAQQAKLFDTFLRAVYAYDDKLELVFSFTGPNRTITLPFISTHTTPNDLISRFVYAPIRGTNPFLNEPSLSCIGSVFVLAIPLPKGKNSRAE